MQVRFQSNQDISNPVLAREVTEFQRQFTQLDRFFCSKDNGPEDIDPAQGWVQLRRANFEGELVTGVYNAGDFSADIQQPGSDEVGARVGQRQGGYQHIEQTQYREHSERAVLSQAEDGTRLYYVG